MTSFDSVGGFEKPRLHRLDTIRLEKGLSITDCMKLFGLGLANTRKILDETADHDLITLARAAAKLEVSIRDVLTDPIWEFMLPPDERMKRLLPMLKAAQAIKESSDPASIAQLAEFLRMGVQEIMPETAEIDAWSRSTLR